MVDFALHTAILKEWRESKFCKETQAAGEDLAHAEALWLRMKLVEARKALRDCVQAIEAGRHVESLASEPAVYQQRFGEAFVNHLKEACGASS